MNTTGSGSIHVPKGSRRMSAGYCQNNLPNFHSPFHSCYRTRRVKNQNPEFAFSSLCNRRYSRCAAGLSLEYRQRNILSTCVPDHPENACACKVTAGTGSLCHPSEPPDFRAQQKGIGPCFDSRDCQRVRAGSCLSAHLIGL